MKRPSRSKKRYKNDDERPYFKRGEPVEVTQDFIRNVGDPDFPRYGWIVKKSRPLMSDPGYEYLIERDPEFAADDGYDETYWVNNDQIKGGDFRYNESRLVKEGAGAGYDVGISDLEIGEVTEVKALGDGDYSFTATIKPGNYEISAESYYDDFFWDLHESGINPEAKIDGGVIHGTISPWEDTDDPEEWVRYQVEGNTFNLSFMYGAGWMHANLPEDGQLYIDERIKITPELYFSVDDIQLDALDLAQAVNDGYASLDDRYNDEDEDGEPMDESIRPNKGNEKAIKVSWRFFRQLENIIGEYYGENPENLDLVAEKALKYLAQCGAKKVKGEDPRNVMLSIRMPDEDDDDFRLTKSVYQVVEEVAENNIHINESYDPKRDDGRKRVMDALEEFRQVLWDDTKVDDEEEHDLRRSLYQDVDNAISQAIQKYFKYSRM